MKDPDPIPNDNPVMEHQRSPKTTDRPSVEYGLECYSPHENESLQITYLPDVLSEADTLKNGSNIFFQETSCLKDYVRLTAR